MARVVELRPAARRDLRRLGKFLARMSTLAAERRINWLTDELLTLGERPERGRPLGKGLNEVVLRYARARYAVRYRVTPDQILITRIWHGKENRPR